MRLAPDCYDCLKSLIRQAAGLATQDASLKQRAIEEGIKVLNSEFAHQEISIAIATKIHRVIREITGNPDPYRPVKEGEIRLAKELYPQARLKYEDNFRGYLKLAAAANAIDFFSAPDMVREDIRKPISFIRDDSEQVETRLRKAHKILYLADNAGEVYFDLPLVSWLRQFALVSYVVKPSPVQDDVTSEDIREAGIEGDFGRITSTGVASPGIVFALASEEFKKEFEAADLIFAKGMGHYESLSELPRQGRFFYCLRAKCKPVADSMGVPLNSYVAMLW